MKQLKNQDARNLEYYGMTETMDKLYSDSQKGVIFHGLMHIIESEANICLAYRNIKSNDGSFTPGVDGITIEDIKSIPEKDVIDIVRRKLNNYHPKPVLRKEIPKPNGKTRPLGIPTFWDRLIQQCILQVLQPICEAKFHERSNGFRPNRSAENAIAQCYRMAQQQHLYYVINFDIKGFFDNVNHSKLIKQMWSLGIRDKKLLCIIKEMLKAKIKLQNGELIDSNVGTPQGGVLSPLLANIVLNELDWWIASQWEFMPTHKQYQLQKCYNGTISRGPIFRVLKSSNLKEMYIVRYADDFKIFCRTYEDAKRIFTATVAWLHERLKLEISEEKSGIVNLTEDYVEFLGIKMKLVPKGDKLVVESHMTDKAIKQCRNTLRAVIKGIRNHYNTKEEYTYICKYNATIMGIHNYYDMATHISKDLGRITWDINRELASRLGKNNLKRTGILKDGAIKEKYGKSKQIRFYHGYPLIPLKYVSTKAPQYKPVKVNLYTPEGREEIHKKLSYDIAILYKLMNINGYKESTSIEFVDNKISLYAAQKGKCAVTGRHLEYDDIDCHHILPREQGGTDEYNNLVILDKKVHQLVHATKPDTITKLIQDCGLDDKMIAKVNKLRNKIGIAEIEISVRHF